MITMYFMTPSYDNKHLVFCLAGSYKLNIVHVHICFFFLYIDSLAQDCSYSIAGALGLKQSSTKPLI